MNTSTTYTLRSALPVIGLTALWLSVLNRLLYPSRHTFYHLGTHMDGLVQAVYAIAFALAALVILVAIKNPERSFIDHSRATAALGFAAMAGVLLPVPFTDGTGMAIVAVVVGALLIAAYVSTHFMYWTIRGRAISPRYVGLALTFSLVGFFLIDLIFTLANVHSIAVAAACPFVSACAMLLDSATDAAGDGQHSDQGTLRSNVREEAPDVVPSAPPPQSGADADSELADVLESLSAEYELSKREAELVEFAYRNLSARRIAQELFIAESTVYTHLKRIYRKTGVHSKQELIDLIDARRA